MLGAARQPIWVFERCAGVVPPRSVCRGDPSTRACWRPPWPRVACWRARRMSSSRRMRLVVPEGAPRTVALTLDACSGGVDMRIIDTLLEQSVPATIFVSRVVAARQCACDVFVTGPPRPVFAAEPWGTPSAAGAGDADGVWAEGRGDARGGAARGRARGGYAGRRGGVRRIGIAGGGAVQPAGDPYDRGDGVADRGVFAERG